eukprot:1140086-Amphidinium_carterae.1
MHTAVTSPTFKGSMRDKRLRAVVVYTCGTPAHAAHHGMKQLTAAFVCEARIMTKFQQKHTQQILGRKTSK